jgi:release factor glutamine methyltransferase
VDKSKEALAVAKTNAQACGVGDRIRFYQGSWFKPLSSLKGQISGLISNPPYIPSQEVLGLQPEVTGHEPHLALDGGVDGLDGLRHLVRFGPEYLQPSGLWMVEMMQGQMEAVVGLLNQAGYAQVGRLRDLEGVERFAIARRGGS